mgnify:CR=1 FL=1|tara:strand:+ start:17373 stop:17939 length:567 start_codon:yes stop_codon:yes gene_type:complete
MFRIDSEAHIGNRFTEGDPGLAIPATVVSDEWLNSVQEEIAFVVEENGIALLKANENQLNAALLELALRGGRKTPVTHVLANNSGPSTVTGFPVLNKSNHLMRACFYYIERKTDTQSVVECGLLICRYNSKDDTWDQESLSLFDDGDTVYTIDDADTDAAILQATTGDLTGTTYVGTLKLTQLFEIRA